MAAEAVRVEEPEDAAFAFRGTHERRCVGHAVRWHSARQYQTPRHREQRLGESTTAPQCPQARGVGGIPDV